MFKLRKLLRSKNANKSHVGRKSRPTINIHRLYSAYRTKKNDSVKSIVTGRHLVFAFHIDPSQQ